VRCHLVRPPEEYAAFPWHACVGRALTLAAKICRNKLP
jgi:hypothetical protein